MVGTLQVPTICKPFCIQAQTQIKCHFLFLQCRSHAQFIHQQIFQRTERLRFPYLALLSHQEQAFKSTITKSASPARHTVLGGGCPKVKFLGSRNVVCQRKSAGLVNLLLKLENAQCGWPGWRSQAAFGISVVQLDLQDGFIRSEML